MSLFWSVADVESSELAEANARAADRHAGKGHDMRLVYGNESALAISVRQPGYHSAPHIHDYEQLNYIQQGEMWFFVHDKPYHVVTGDFLRIPRNVIHWSWVRSDEPCLCYEVFSPTPPMKNMLMNKAEGLFDEGEVPDVRSSLGVYYIDPAFHGLNIAEIESRPAVNRVPADS